MELTIEQIKALSKLVVDHKLDSLEYGSLKLTKTKHEPPKTEKAPATNPVFLTDEELLFASTSAPVLTPEEIEAFAINPPQRKKSKVKGQ